MRRARAEPSRGTPAGEQGVLPACDAGGAGALQLLNSIFSRVPHHVATGAFPCARQSTSGQLETPNGRPSRKR